MAVSSAERARKVTVYPCPACRDVLGVVYEHPPYFLPHGHGYPAMDMHYTASSGWMEPCRGSGQHVPRARARRA